MKTPDHFALENFLHNELAEKRIQEIQSESWYAVTSDEIDLAIERTETFGNEHLNRKQQVALIKNVQSDGRWLEPNDRLKEIYARLSKLILEKNALCHEEELLELEAKAQIGTADGVDGLFAWQSHETARFQTKIFKAQYPDLYDEFRKTTYVRNFNLWSGEEEDCEEEQ